MATKPTQKEPIKMKMKSSEKMMAIVPDKELELKLNEALNNKSIIMVSIVTDIGEDGNNIYKNWWKLNDFPTRDISIVLEGQKSSLVNQMLMGRSTRSGGSGASKADYNRIMNEYSQMTEVYQKKIMDEDKRSKL